MKDLPMRKVHKEDLKRAEEWMEESGCGEACGEDSPAVEESLAEAFSALRMEVLVSCKPGPCQECGKTCYYGERIREGDKIYCDYECAEFAGEDWAQK